MRRALNVEFYSSAEKKDSIILKKLCISKNRIAHSVILNDKKDAVKALRSIKKSYILISKK